MSYDFHQLSPHDLELLVQDLLQAEWGIVLEGFKGGRDGGVDLRYARDQNSLVVQVKHYVKTGLAGLMRDLTKEVEKVRRLKPTRYVVATSVPLSPENKAAISALFGGPLAVDDVLGQEDLNTLLRRHTTIEQNHYKLWLASRGVLDRVLHNNLVTQSEFQVEQVYATIRRNVRSDAYNKALDILERDRVVIVSGAPGVGKTTLASMLLYAHLEKDWRPVVIRQDIAEGQKLFQRGVLQIFYFDDFMGATFLGERGTNFSRNEDRGITDFIEMVRASPTARLILTTREHIFGQAMALSERLRQAGLSDHKMILRIGDYTYRQKAEILYNHLYFSDLPEAYRDALLSDKFYLEVVKHPKFNPRLIEWLSSFNRVRTIAPAQYQTFVRNLLQDPSDVWLHAYEQQLGDAGRSLLLAIFSLGGKAEGRLLKVAFAQLHKVRAERWGLSRQPDDWSTAMSELLNAFIRPTGATGFEVLDPSVIDLVNAVVRKAPENAVDLVLGASDFFQTERVWMLATLDKGEVWTALRSGGPTVAEAIRQQLVRPTRLLQFSNGVLGIAWTPEGRLAEALRLADRLRTPAMLALVQDLAAAMKTGWASEGIDINGGAEALGVLQSVAWEQIRSRALEEALRQALLASAQKGVRSDELREILRVLSLEGPENAATLSVLRGAFEHSRQSIADEIRECTQEDEFKGLEEDYDFFTSCLGVDVSQELERLSEAYGEYLSHEDQDAEAMSDAARERYRSSYGRGLDSDDSLHELFASLRGD